MESASQIGNTEISGTAVEHVDASKENKCEERCTNMEILNVSLGSGTCVSNDSKQHRTEKPEVHQTVNSQAVSESINRPCASGPLDDSSVELIKGISSDNQDMNDFVKKVEVEHILTSYKAERTKLQASSIDENEMLAKLEISSSIESSTKSAAEESTNEIPSMSDSNVKLRGILKRNSEESPRTTGSPSDNRDVGIRVYVKNVSFSYDVDDTKNEIRGSLYRKSHAVKGRRFLHSMAHQITYVCKVAKIKLQMREDELKISDHDAKEGKLHSPWHFKQNLKLKSAESKEEPVQCTANKDVDTESLQSESPGKTKVSDVIHLLRFNKDTADELQAMTGDKEEYCPVDSSKDIVTKDFGATVVREIVIAPLSKRNLMSKESVETHTFACETVGLVNEFLRSLLRVEGYLYLPDYEIEGITEHYREDVGRNLGILGKYWGTQFITYFQDMCENEKIGSIDIFEKFVFTFSEHFLQTEEFELVRLVTFFACCSELALHCANTKQLSYTSTLSHMMVACILLHAMTGIQDKGGWSAFIEFCTKKPEEITSEQA